LEGENETLPKYYTKEEKLSVIQQDLSNITTLKRIQISNSAQ
jgi:hypothetical protein